MTFCDIFRVDSDIMDLQGNNHIRMSFFICFLLGIKYLLYELFRYDDQNQQRLYKRSKNKQFVTSVNLFTHETVYHFHSTKNEKISPEIHHASDHFFLYFVSDLKIVQFEYNS